MPRISEFFGIMIYYSDLSSLKDVYCYPKSNEEWKKVNIDSYGLGLMWSSRFEVHVDQVIALATKVEAIKKSWVHEPSVPMELLINVN